MAADTKPPEYLTFFHFRNVIDAWVAWKKQQRSTWQPQMALVQHNLKAARDGRSSDTSTTRRRKPIKRLQTYLNIISGKTRSPSADKVEQLSLVMDLSDGEARHFIALAELERAQGNDKHREDYFGRVQKHLTQPVSGATSAIANNWYYPAIQMLSLQPDFVKDSAWVQQRLRSVVPLEDLDEALELLTSLQLLGTQKRFDTGSNAVGERYYRYCEQILGLGQKVLAERADDHVFINGIMAVPVSQLPELQRKIHEAMVSLALKEDQHPLQSDEPRVVYQASIMILPLTSPIPLGEE